MTMTTISATRVAILTDVHGNDDALLAALKDGAKHDPELYVFSGDLVLDGPRPAEALARIIEMQMPAVMGNMDDLLVRGGDVVGDCTKAQLTADQSLIWDRCPSASGSRRRMENRHNTTCRSSTRRHADRRMC